jgi:GNAT superfamily N-acetyltransferase
VKVDLTIQPVENKNDLRAFVEFPWHIYKDDPYWVPPLLDDRYSRLDVARNPYWQDAERVLWLARLGSQPVGTIASIIDHRRNQNTGKPLGVFGFFECINDESVAKALLKCAGDWLRQHSFSRMIGPYNPSESDELGILIEGFDTRPAIMEAHTPSYYPVLFNGAGCVKYNDLVARLAIIPPECETLDQIFPEKLRRIAEQVSHRPDVHIRKVKMQEWQAEIRMACRLYNEDLGPVPDIVPISEDEFLVFANSFKAILSPEMVLIAEVDSRPVGFAIALPDVNEALQHVDGKLGPLGLAKFWWFSRKINRVSFKILIMVPEYQGRGIEALLTYRVAQAIWKQGYKEIDMSLTGEENLKSSLFQERIGFNVYRRYRIYQKDLS